MKYKYVPYDQRHYATDLQRKPSEDRLDWECSPGQDVIILQTPYGIRATDYAREITGNNQRIIEAVCDTLADVRLLADEYTEVLPSVWVRFVSAATKVRLRGCPLHGEASTYAVFACETNEETGVIYAPRDQAMISPFCDIPLELHVEIIRDTVSVKRLFRTVEQETGFYVLTFPQLATAAYQDGTMSVLVEDISIPVTRGMLERGMVYIRTQTPPKITTKNPGLKIV